MKNYNELKLTELIQLCYIATPYRGANDLAIEQNILDARKAAVALMQATDYFPMSPVLNTAGFEHYEELLDGKGDRYWLNGTKELLNRCNAIYMAPGWEASSGCIGEIEWVLNQMIGTEARDIKIFINSDDEGYGIIVEVMVGFILDILKRIDK